MLLNSEQMKAQALISDADVDAYRETTYDLQIGEILPAPSLDGARAKDLEVSPQGFYLRPQGMVKVVSREVIKLPRGVAGYALLRNTLSNAGLLAINIGFIDPGYEGPISSTLINFGKNPFLLTPNMTFLRLRFHHYTPTTAAPKEPFRPISKEDYLKRTRTEVDANFSSSFLNLQQTAQDAARIAFGSFKEWLIFWAAVLAVALALLTIFVPLGAAYADRYVFKADDFERRIADLEKAMRDQTTRSALQPSGKTTTPTEPPDTKK